MLLEKGKVAIYKYIMRDFDGVKNINLAKDSNIYSRQLIAEIQKYSY